MPGAFPPGPPNVPGPYAPGPPGAPGAYPPGMPRQQARLDPNVMPSLVQVVEDDRATYLGNAFQTGYPEAAIPPLVTTDFTGYDMGKCLGMWVE